MHMYSHIRGTQTEEQGQVMWVSAHRIQTASVLVNPTDLLHFFFFFRSIGLILLKRKRRGRGKEPISFFCIFLIQHLIQKSLQRFRQAHHHHHEQDFHSETTQDAEEEEYYLTPRRACLEVSPPCPALPCPAVSCSTLLHPALPH